MSRPVDPRAPARAMIVAPQPDAVESVERLLSDGYVRASGDPIDISNRIPRRVGAGLVAAGHEVRRSPQSFAFAALHGIAGWGALEGGADPQRDGYAAGL